MFALEKALKSSPLVYVTRDIERALGEPLNTKNYYIISNHSAFAKSIARNYPNVLLIKGKKKLDTHELLERPETAKLLSQLKKPRLLVFKNTSQIEKICSEHGWPLLNPPAELASKVEQKISQVSWLGPLQKYLPPHEIKLCRDLKWAGKKYIIQFNSAHTGNGTILVESEKQINELAEKFPDRDVRITEFVDGPAFTNNNVVWGNRILVGNINYQITGLSPFTQNPFATIGNDWALPNKLLNAKQIKQYQQLATDIGKRLARDGWKGLFGIDVILEKKSGKLYLIEINARQPASTTFESQLQQAIISSELAAASDEKSLSQPHNGQRSLTVVRDDNKTITTFEAHLASLLGVKPDGYKLIKITDGAQIIKRVPVLSLRAVPTGRQGAKRRGNPPTIQRIKRLKDYKIIEYDNTKPGEDLLRIQGNSGIMTGHNKFNKIGKEIKNITVEI